MEDWARGDSLITGGEAHNAACAFGTLARCVAVRLLPPMSSMRRRMVATSVVLTLQGGGGGTKY